MSRVTVLGLGAMGQRMAANLLAAGHTVAVWNRTQARADVLAQQGATVHATPRAAVQQAEVVISMLRDDVASRSVWLDAEHGALAAMPADSIAVECSTLSLDWCAELATEMKLHAIEFVDAPVVGSRPQAEARQLIHLLGGSVANYERLQAILSASAAQVLHAGPVAAGLSLKLAVNALFGIQVVALAELLGFLQRQGLELSNTVPILNALPVISPAAKGAALALAAQNFAPMFPLELAHKDMGYVLEAAHRAAAGLPLSSEAYAQFSRALEHGFGPENLHAVAKLFVTDE